MRSATYDASSNLSIRSSCSSLCWSKGKKKGQVQKDRFVSKMFLRGDSVILVLKNPAGLAK